MDRFEYVFEVCQCRRSGLRAVLLCVKKVASQISVNCQPTLNRCFQQNKFLKSINFSQNQLDERSGLQFGPAIGEFLFVATLSTLTPVYVPANVSTTGYTKHVINICGSIWLILLSPFRPLPRPNILTP